MRNERRQEPMNHGIVTSRYKAIIFDLDGTLRVSRPRFMDALLDIIRGQGFTVNEARWKEVERWVHYYWARSPELQYDMEQHGDGYPWPLFMQRLLTKAGCKASPEDVRRLVEVFGEVYQPESVLMPGARETLEQLRARDWVIGILSNRRDPYHEELDALGIAEFFDFVLAAGEVGIWKPEPGVFHVALERAGNIPPQASVYIGDNYYADVMGARAAGMDVILVDSRGIFEDADCPRVRALPEIVHHL